MYVAEYLKFPDYAIEGKRASGRIRRLRDRDGDGQYEESQVFADGLEWPTGICSWKGGVFVIAAPDLWYLKDTDGDGTADVRKKVYTGFGFNNEEGTANNLVWGLDHWIYGAGSNSGGQVRPADQPKTRAVSLRGRDFRFHPATGKFEAISGSEQFGNTLDDWGNRFICQNSKPAVHVVLPARYLSRNPYLPVPAVCRNIWKGDHVYRVSPPERWRLARTKLRLAKNPNYAAPSVAHDVFTACTGVTIYRGAAYPKQYHGNLFVGDVQSNLIHRRTMHPRGVTFESRRADDKTEMVRSKDNWFRPANMVNAPDGTLHIVDMYREVIETPISMPDEIIATVDLLSGNKHGRVYRLAPPGFKVPKPPRLESAMTEQLVRELENANGWWRDSASRLLYERQDRRAVEPLRVLLRETPYAPAQLHAMYALHGLGALSDEDIERGLAAPSAGVREHAVRLAEPRLQASDRLLGPVVALAKDENARVRFQVAFSLGETDDPRAAEALANLARRGAGDVWMRTAVLSSTLDSAAGMLEALLGDATFVKEPGGQQFLRQLAWVVGGRNRPAEVVGVLKVLETSPGAKRGECRRAVMLGLGEGLRRSRSDLSRYTRGSHVTAELMSGLVDNARRMLASRSSTSKQREQAIAMLVHGRYDDVQASLVAMLDSRQAPSVQLAAVQALASFEKTEVPVVLINAWQGMSPAVRGEVVETLLGRRAWVLALLDAVESKQVASGYIDPVRKERLMKHRDAPIRARAAKLFSKSLSPRADVVEAYRSALTLTGDAVRGRRIFEQNCMTCHKVAGRGHDVGPNLATVLNQTPEGLMLQILDPNREVLANFTQYVVVTDHGRVVSGLIASETPTSITLKRAENVEETILRKNIDEVVGSGKSLMPEGLELKIDKQQMSDLLAFLLGLQEDAQEEKPPLKIAMFQCDVTPPVGSPLCFGFVPPAERIVDRLSARGMVLLTAEKPIILCVVDWAGISNGSHDAWRKSLADAVGTTTDRVSVHVVHQHDAPGVDFNAAEILAAYGHRGAMFDEAFARDAIRRAAEAARVSVEKPYRVSHLGYGKAPVQKFASNRRVLGPDGKIKYWRGSTTKDADARAEPEGTVDANMRSVSFWDGDTPRVSLTYYASHPQSYYGRGGVSADTVGQARTTREEALPQVAHLHFNGAGGNIAAGKYNDGAMKNRKVLASRLAVGMEAAWNAMKKTPVTAVDVRWTTRSVKLPIKQAWDKKAFVNVLDDPESPSNERIMAAFSLAWMNRNEAGQAITIGCLGIGPVRILHMPGELFVEYQLAAQKMRPDLFVCMAGYGDWGPGYIGTRVAYSQGGYEVGPMSRTAPEVEGVLQSAMRSLLKASISP